MNQNTTSSRSPFLCRFIIPVIDIIGAVNQIIMDSLHLFLFTHAILNDLINSCKGGIKYFLACIRVSGRILLEKCIFY